MDCSIGINISPATQWAWRSAQRYYAATLTADLFETPVLVLQWGGLDSHRGGMKTLVVDSDEHGRALVHQIDKRRQARGYRVVDRDASPTPCIRKRINAR